VNRRFQAYTYKEEGAIHRRRVVKRKEHTAKVVWYSGRYGTIQQGMHGIEV
jgi:hypothetical protein